MDTDQPGHGRTRRAAFATGLTLAVFLQEESEADLVTVKLSGMFRRG